MSTFSDQGVMVLQVGSGASRSFSVGHAADWEMYLLLAMVALVAVIRLLRPVHLSNLWIAFTSFKLANQMFRTEQRYTWSTVALLGNTIVLLAIILASAVQYWAGSATITYTNMVLVLVGCLSTLLLLRFTVPTSIAGLFKAKPEQEAYDAHWLMTLQCLGLFMLPMAIAGKVLPQLTWFMIVIAVVMGCLAILYSLGRGFLLSQSQWTQRPAHFFLYLCSLYLAALAVVVKAFANYVLEK